MKCGFCHQPLSKSIPLEDLIRFRKIYFNHCCQNCFNELKRCIEKEEKNCYYCQKKIKKGKKCVDCKMWERKNPNFQLKHQSLFVYNDKMKAYFQRYKFVGDVKMSKVFAKEIQQELEPFVKQGYLIVPIPLSKERLLERGFNQVESLLVESDIPFQTLLSKKMGGKCQSEKNKEERINTEQPFLVKKQYKTSLKNQKIVIVDDVYTTGRTILHAYDCLLAYSPLVIRSFSLSR